MIAACIAHFLVASIFALPGRVTTEDVFRPQNSEMNVQLLNQQHLSYCL